MLSPNLPISPTDYWYSLGEKGVTFGAVPAPSLGFPKIVFSFKAIS